MSMRTLQATGKKGKRKGVNKAVNKANFSSFRNKVRSGSLLHFNHPFLWPWWLCSSLHTALPLLFKMLPA